MTVELIAGTNPEPFSTSKTSNWVARVGGLPTLIQHVAHDLLESGSAHSTSHAIEMAVGIVKNWAHGHDGRGHPVTPPTVAEAVKAMAEWAAKRARAKALAHTPEEHEAVALCFGLTTADVIELAPAIGPVYRKGAATRRTKKRRTIFDAPPPLPRRQRRAARGGSAGPSSGGSDGFTERLHPRVGRGKSGGGRFAKKGGGQEGDSAQGINPDAMPTTERGHKIGSRAHARDVVARIGGVRRGGDADRERAKKTGQTVLVRKWNALPRERRLEAMRAFKKRMAKLPKGWKFDSDGKLTIGKGAALANVIRRAIFGPDIELATPDSGTMRKLVQKGHAMPAPNQDRPGRFNIRNRSELSDAIRAVGRAKPATEEERAKVRRFIIKRARELGATDMIPDNWGGDGSLKS